MTRHQKWAESHIYYYWATENKEYSQDICTDIIKLISTLKNVIVACFTYPVLKVVEREVALTWGQWRNSRGRVPPPRTSHREISADLPGKERQGKMEKKGRKSKKGRWITENWRGDKLQTEERIFFLLFLHLIFQNHWNLFWVFQNKNFLLGKSVSHWEKNQEKWLCPSEKYSSYVSACGNAHGEYHKQVQGSVFCLNYLATGK